MTMLNNRKWKGQAAPEWATAVVKLNRCWYWEESVEQKLGDRFCRCGSDFEAYTRTYNPSTARGYDEVHLLPPLETEDDPLPPAPESVMYFNHDNTRKLTAAIEGTVVAVGAEGTCLKVRMPPDAVLQLAHDLRRMAMDIKRKQKGVD